LFGKKVVTGEKREAYERLMTEKAERKGRRDEGRGRGL
jgi:hypothetical protein